MTAYDYDYESYAGESLATGASSYTTKEENFKNLSQSQTPKNDRLASPDRQVTPNYDYEFQAGGSLAADAPGYVEREADTALYRAVKAGKFAYVFNCRQMGKSSLRVRTEIRLKAEQIRCAAVDLSAVGTEEVSAAQWYRTLIGELNRCLALLSPQEVNAWLEKQEGVTPVYQLHCFIEDVVLVRIPNQQIVVFVDEIDSVLSLSFPANDFFSWIRACYNRQVDNVAYRRLTFVLLGVTTPSQLIRDKTRTPFNTAQAIELTPLSLERAGSLANGLIGWTANPQRLLAEIFKWTGGQPYLTQRLCMILHERAMESGDLPWIAAKEEAEIVAEIVRRDLIDNWESKDDQAHFKTIRDRLLRREHLANRLLGIYEQILTQGKVQKDDSDAHMELQLSGLVVNHNGYLEVFNSIYEQIFNQVWVQTTLENLRPYAESFSAWVSSDYVDESRLLRGQALKDALNWSNGKSLSDLDYRFLTASQEVYKREVQIALEVKEKEKQVLTKANQTAKRTIRRGIAGLILVSSVAAALITGISVRLKSAQTAINLEQQGINVLRNIECCRGGTELLAQAMQVNQRLKSVVGGNTPVEEYPATTPILGLQRILDNFYNRDRLKAFHDNQFSPAKQLIATAGEDGQIKIWNSSGEERFAVKGHDGEPVYSVQFSPSGRRLISIGEDKTVKVWTLTESKLEEVLTIQRIEDGFHDIGFSPDEENIATIGSDDVFRLWNLSSKKIAAQWKIKQDEVWRVRFSPNGRHFATSGEDGIIRLWDFSGKKLAQWEADQNWVASMAFTPDGQRLAMVGLGSKVRLWDLSGNLLKEWKAEQSWCYTSLRFSPDGQYLATGGWTDTVQIWNLSGESLTEIQSYPGELTSLSFSPDGQKLATAGQNGALTVWDSSSGKQETAIVKGERSSFDNIWLRDKRESITEEREVIEDVEFSLDWQRFASVSEHGMVKLWHRSGQLQGTLGEHEGEVEDVVFSRDGDTLTVIRENGVAELWDFSGPLISILEAPERKINQVEFSPNRQHLMTVAAAPESVVSSAQDSDSRDGLNESAGSTIQLWNLEGEELTNWKTEEHILNAKFSFDGQFLATIGEDGTVQIRNISGKILSEISNQDKIRDIEFSPREHKIVSVDEGGTIQLLNFSGEVLKEWTVDGELYYTNFAPDGQHFATADEDGLVHIWTLQGTQLAALQGHGDGVTDVNFSPDGRQITTLAFRSARMWDMRGRQLAEFGWVSDISPNGKYVAELGESMLEVKHVRDLDTLLSDGCERLQSYFVTHPNALEKLEICQPPREQAVADSEYRGIAKHLESMSEFLPSHIIATGQDFVEKEAVL